MLHKEAVEPNTLELLKELCQIPRLSSFALGGGTNLALKNGHRLSADLDFFTNREFETSQVYNIISKTGKKTELLFEQNQTMMFVIDGVKIDFILYPFEWFYPFEIIEGARLLHTEDIIPMKLQAVSNRFAKKDFWDIEKLLKEYPLYKMLEIFSRKFPTVDTGYLVQSLTNFEDADNQDDPVSLENTGWPQIKESLQKEVINYTNGFL